MEKKVALHNLGCKVNAYELEAMEQMLKNAGYEIVPFAPGADIYIINTCTVTNIADRKSRQMLHKAKKMNPQAVVVAAGNAANQRRHYQKRGMEEGAVESIELSVGSNLAGFQMESGRWFRRFMNCRSYRLPENGSRRLWYVRENGRNMYFV